MSVRWLWGRNPPITGGARWGVRAVLLVVLGVAVLLAYLGTTFISYSTDPAYGVTFSARVAEWGRDHGLGFIVTWAEQEQYRLNPPKVGGKPPQGSFGYGPTKFTIPAGGHLPAPARLVSPAGPWLAGEGVWHAVGRTGPHGIPTTYEAFVRPDALHTSFVAGVAWMDPTLLRASLYSGSYIPGGGPYTNSAPITSSASRTLVDAFNAGFRVQDANGGYYTDHRMVVPLRNGAASIVIFKDGTMTVAQWGRDAKLTPNVVSVRQNLNLIVDGGHAVAGLNANDDYVWGATLGGGAYVWRSGLGVTRDGALVYVAGPALSITSLANLFVDAGCVRAMELDINPDWVQFSHYQAAPNARVNGANGVSLLPSMLGAPSRYFESWWNRDFFTLSLRPATSTTTTTTTTAPHHATT